MKTLLAFKKMMGQLNAMINSRQRIKMVLMFVVITIGSMFELIGVTAILPFIQAILSPEDLVSNKIVGALLKVFKITDSNLMIIFIGICVIVVYIVKNLYLSLSSYLQADYCNRTTKELSVSMVDSYMQREYAFFTEEGSGEIWRGINADAKGIYNVIVAGFKLLSEVLLAASITVYLFFNDTVLSIGVVSVCLLCLLVVINVFKKKISKASKRYRKANKIQHKWVMQIVNGIKEILIFKTQGAFLNKYDDAYEDANKANTEYTFLASLPERIIETACIAGIIVAVLVRVMMGVDVNSFVSKLSVFAVGAFKLLPSVSRIAQHINTVIFNQPMIESSYKNIMAARLRLEEESKQTNELDNGQLSFNRSILIDNIDWCYANSKNKVLDKLTLEIKKGEAIGIIGESGSGKSTLADILLRLYVPKSGKIYMDDIDINTIPKSWAKVVSYVPQTVFLTDDTIRENVAFGDKEIDDERIWEALKKASFDEYVRKLPNGLDTIVGEFGVKFSGGQRQRIAIARALYRNPEILILDEATSALDNETEEVVMEAIDSLVGKMTLLIIAHRVTTLRNCDKIYEVTGGKAVERRKEDVIKI